MVRLAIAYIGVSGQLELTTRKGVNALEILIQYIFGDLKIVDLDDFGTTVEEELGERTMSRINAFLNARNIKLEWMEI